MRSVITILLCILQISSLAQSAQEAELKKKVFIEMTSVIENPFVFLGKPDAGVAAAGRPKEIKGGSDWKVEVKEIKDKNLQASKTIVISTGCSTIMLTVSRATGLIFNLIYIPKPESKVTGKDIIENFMEKYQFDERHACVFESGKHGKVGMAALKGSLTMMAVEEDGKTLRFSK